MRHKWILLMCAGVILMLVTIANPVAGYPTNGGDSDSQNQSTYSNQTYSTYNKEYDLVDSSTAGLDEKPQTERSDENDEGNLTGLNSTDNSIRFQNENGTDLNNEKERANFSTSEATNRAGRKNNAQNYDDLRPSYTTTTEKPYSICTKSGLNYDCILRDIQLSKNDSNNFGLSWKINTQKRVTFEGSRLEYLPKKLIDGFPQMELLNAEGLQMEDIEDKAFKYAANLKQLYLQNNRLTSINGFKGVLRLIHLDLSNNKINNIVEDAFLNNLNLKNILLNNNLILKLPKTNKLINLQTLNVANNEINKISDQQFSKNNKLEQLDVSFNNLSQFDMVQLDDKPYLSVINVSHNKLESLYIPIKVKLLKAANNSIQVLTVNECNVERLDISHNQITDVAALQKCTDLKILDLSYNRLQSFDLIKSFSKLFYLNLAHNHLFEITFPTNFHPIQFLDLSFNQLSFGPSNKFTLMKNIKLNNNKFMEFKFDDMKQLNYILISNNEWSCEKIQNVAKNETGNVFDAKEVCYGKKSLNGICCKDYKRAFNDRLKEIMQETYIHTNLNAQDLGKCNHTKPASEVEKPNIATLHDITAQLDSSRKIIVNQIDNNKKKISDLQNQISMGVSQKSGLNKKLKNYNREVHKFREQYGVINEGLIKTEETLNRVLQFTQERKKLNDDLLERRKLEVQETQNRLDDLTETITTANTLNSNLKDKLASLKKEETKAKKERQQLEKDANKNSASLHGSRG